MRRITSLVLATAIAIYGLPSITFAAPNSGAVAGVAQSSGGAPFANHIARLRSVNSGSVVDTTATTQVGSFEFSSVLPGSYVVEVTDATGRVVATSGVTSVIGGGIAVAKITAVMPIAGGSVGTPLLLMLLAASAAGTVGIWSAGNRDEASPSR